MGDVHKIISSVMARAPRSHDEHCGHATFYIIILVTWSFYLEGYPAELSIEDVDAP